MRKAGQVGLWLLLMASVLVSSSALAQEGPPPEAPGRVESEPQLAATSTAWHAAWRANVEAHLRTVAARGTPRDLLVAGLLWPVEEDAERIPTDDAFFAPQARAWIQAAYERSHGDDALVDWTLLNTCPVTGADCDRATLLQRLMAADPGNAEILLTAYQDAVGRNDTVAAERYWQAASAGTHYRPRINELGTLMVSELRKVPVPVLDPALATAMGEIVQLGRDATPRDIADLGVMARLAALALPTFVPVRERCDAQVGSLLPAALSACRRIHGLLADDETILISQMVGLPRLVE